jgi:hypothetical protein
MGRYVNRFVRKNQSEIYVIYKVCHRQVKSSNRFPKQNWMQKHLSTTLSLEQPALQDGVPRHYSHDLVS